MEEENIFESDYLYIKKKTEILETCECPKNTNTINSRDARTNTNIYLHQFDISTDHILPLLFRHRLLL